jgi:hypothetical protein
MRRTRELEERVFGDYARSCCIRARCATRSPSPCTAGPEARSSWTLLPTPLNFEAGGPAALTGALIHPLEGERGVFEADQLGMAIRSRSRYAPGARYRTCSALRRASIVSSTVRRTVVSNELSAPPLIASATAAIDTLSGASHRL